MKSDTRAVLLLALASACAPARPAAEPEQAVVADPTGHVFAEAIVDTRLAVDARRWDGAVKAAEKGLRGVQPTSDRAVVAELHEAIAVARASTDRAAAIKALEKAVRVRKELAPDAALVEDLLALGRLHGRACAYDASAAWFDRARETARSLGEQGRFVAIVADGQRAGVHQAKGEHALAEPLLERAAADLAGRAIPTGEHGWALAILGALAATQHVLGHLDRERATVNRALALAAETRTYNYTTKQLLDLATARGSTTTDTARRVGIPFAEWQSTPRKDAAPVGAVSDLFLGQSTCAEPKPRSAKVANAEQVVAGLKRPFRACYNRGLSRSAELRGVMRIGAKIGSDGKVASVSGWGIGLDEDTLACAGTAVSTAVFAPPDSGSATIVIPVTYVKGDAPKPRMELVVQTAVREM